ncbi:hypothetical protein C0J52_20468 [Blattella germanica]|nr:hypothetical protein C0J52_20468 [Blattella germanica]
MLVACIQLSLPLKYYHKSPIIYNLKIVIFGYKIYMKQHYKFYQLLFEFFPNSKSFLSYQE